jgi:acyl carrier protein
VVVTEAQIRDSIRTFVLTELIKANESEGVKDDQSLFRHEIIDSVSILQLLAFVDCEFDLRIESGEVTQENFDSIARVASYVTRKLAGAGEQQQLAA